MSRLKLNALRNTAGTTDSLSINADGSVSTLGGKLSPFTGFKNRIINGDMRIDQRNAGASITPDAGIYTLDRWQYGITVASKFAIQRNAGAVTPPPGFTNYLGLTSVSAYTLSAGNRIGIFHPIEGFNVADLAWGTANAQPITVSFLVRSSLTGTFGGLVANGGYNRGYTFSYTINAPNTWEYKTITIPGDTTGTWQTDASTGLAISWAVAVHSGLQGEPGSWGSTVTFAPTGQVNVAGTNGATFYITGVQLEKGGVATEFDRRDYGRELAMCQRYYFYTGATYGNGVFNGGGAYMSCQFPVTMRASATVTLLVQSGSAGTISSANATGWYGYGGAGASAVQWKAEAEL